MTDNPYTLLNSQTMYSCPWYRVRQDKLLLPDGSPGEYNVILRPDAVYIVPVLESGELVLIRNYRHTINSWLWEIPAGSNEPSLSPLENAQKELAEEIGGTAKSFNKLGVFYTIPGVSNEAGHFYLAQGVTLGEPNHEPSEVIERYTLSLERVEQMLRRGEIQDGPSALALHLALPHLNGVK